MSRVRLFVSEYVCGGGWPQPELPESLAREGRAMWQAVINAFCRLPGITIETTCDHRLGLTPWEPTQMPSLKGAVGQVHVHIVEGADHEQRLFREILARVDAALIIAPETDSILKQRCRIVGEFPSVTSLNATPEAIHLCGDKRLLHLHLSRVGIPMPRQWTVADASSADTENLLFTDAGSFRHVVKLRDGAGSQDMQLLTTGQLREWLSVAERDPCRASRWVIEEFIPGRSISVAGLFDDAGRLRHLLPMAEQHLSDDGRFCYLGGRLPASDVDFGSVPAVVTKAAAAITGLRGYVGFDLVIPHDKKFGPYLIEINPRLTTSFVGCSALCIDALARWLIPGDVPAEPPIFSTDSITFAADGSIA